MKVRPSAGGFGDPVHRAVETRRGGRAPRDWAVDTLCFLLGIGFTALAFVDVTDRGLPPALAAVEAALGGLVSLGLWLRRRWPVGFAVFVGLFAIYSISASAVGLIALFTVAVHRRPGTAVLVAAGYALTSFLALLGPARRGAAEPVAGRTRRRLCRGGPRVGGCSCGPGGNSTSPSTNGPRPNRSSGSPRPGRPSATGSRGRCTTCSPIACRC